MAEITIKDLIKQIIPSLGQSDPKTLEEAQGVFYEKYNFENGATDIWKGFLDFLNQEITNGYLHSNNSNLPITEDLFNQSTTETLFKYINNKIDLNENLFEELYDSYKDKLSSIDLSTASGLISIDNQYWNESVSKLVATLIKNLTKDGIKKGLDIIIDSNHKAVIANIFGADAATNNNAYVKPDKNMSQQAYTTVRGSDLIKEDTELDKVQYTNSVADTVIRLIMPKYSREVKVEDLNRNFWVISQIIGLINAYLFEDSSPIIDMFKKILSELMQLWENLLYLWALFAVSIYNKKEYTDVHTEIIYLPYDEYITYFKNDNFDNFIDISEDNKFLQSVLDECVAEIKKRIKYMEDMYPQSNLCIIPVIRKDNYKYNYYNKEIYLGAFLFDRNKKESNQSDGWSTVLFLQGTSSGYFSCTPLFAIPSTRVTLQYGFQVGPQCSVAINGSVQDESALIRCDTLLTGIADNGNGTYKVYHPMSKVNNYEEWNSGEYISFIRTQYSVLPNYNEICTYDSTNKKLVFNGLDLIFSDGVGEEYYTIENDNKNYYNYLKWTLRIESGDGNTASVYMVSYPSAARPSSGNILNGVKDNVYISGYYLGEVPSELYYSKQYEPSFKTKNIYGRPLINELKDIPGLSDNFSGNNTVFNTLIDKDADDLNKYFEENTDIIEDESKDFYFYFLTHQYGIEKKRISNTNKGYIQNYYDWNGSTFQKIETSNNNKSLISINPVLYYNNDEFQDTILSQCGLPALEDGYGYGRRAGNVSNYCCLWNPFIQERIPLPGFLNYTKIILNPSSKLSPILYNEDNQQIEAADCIKNNAVLRLSAITQKNTDGSYKTTPNLDDITFVYSNSTYTNTSFGILDKSGKVSDDNWYIKYNSATVVFAPHLDKMGVIYMHEQDKAPFLNSCNFRPFNMNNLTYRDSYIPAKSDLSSQDISKMVFYSLKKSCSTFYHIDTNNYYRAPFFTIGWINVNDYFDNFETFINQTSQKQAYATLMNVVNNNDTYTSSIGNTITDAMSTLLLDIIPSYVYTINDAIVFGNYNYATMAQRQVDLQGYNYITTEKQGFFSPNFRQSTYLPNFEYNSNYGIDYNYTMLKKALAVKATVLYSSSTCDISKFLDIDGNAIFQSQLKLDFSTYPNNGYISHTGTWG